MLLYVCHVKGLSDVLGQDAAVSALRRALEQDRLASAYLFEGPPSVGKATTALAFCRDVILSGLSEPERQVQAHLLESGNHPDLRVFEPRDTGSRNIAVELIRKEVLPFAQYAPFKASRAFVVFPDADVSFPETHAEAANAMLKTLEEPKADLHFVLTSSRPQRLLPTIRSRAVPVRFSPLDDGSISDILAAHGIPKGASDISRVIAGGRLDRALGIAGDGQAEQWVALVDRLDAAIDDDGVGELTRLAEDIAKDTSTDIFFDLAVAYYRDVAVSSLGVPTDQLVLAPCHATVTKRAALLSAAKAAQRVDIVQRTRDKLDRNANVQIALDALFAELSLV